MGKVFQQLTLEEREQMYSLREQGLSFRDIGKKLGRSHQTLSREYKRNRRAGEEYLPCRAQRASDKRKQDQRTRAPLKNHLVFLYVREKLREEQWSPETIAGRLSFDHPGESITAETIYEYIYGKGRKYELWQYLPNKRKKRRQKLGRGVQKARQSSLIPDAVCIEKRSTKANNRSQAGHWETDLMEGIRGHKGALSVTVERQSRYSILSKVQNKKPEIVQKALQNRMKNVQSLQKSRKPIVRSITSDNGVENMTHKNFSEELQADWFFCRPYHSWEKGSVENMIGRIRRYIPKKTSLREYTPEQIIWLEDKLNNTPRKCLGWQTPNEIFSQTVNHYKFQNYLNHKSSGAFRS